MFSLLNKKIVVTGAGSGIGAAIAELFSKAGGSVFVADRDEASGRAVAKHVDGEFLLLDVCDEEACQRVADDFEQSHGGLDVLVNNAGVGGVGTILETSGHDMDRMYAVNVRGLFNVSRAFLPGMLQAGHGNIINLASVGGVVGIRDRLAYCTTKFAVVGITKSMALDHASQGIRVNCLCPGRVETPFVEQRLKEYPDPEKARREMAATQAIGRMGRPGEIAAAALYLASDESSFVTGSAFLIDGGWSAGK